MHRFLERLDGAASTIVPLAYLAGLMLGTMAYFTGITLNLGLAVGIALACAAELHSFLEQRRCRALYATWARARHGAHADDRAGMSAQAHAQLQQLLIHFAILCALVAFSAVNATAFVAETWTPARAFFLPIWLQIGIRGCVVPILFLLAGFLAPLHADAGDLLASASHAMLHKAIKATVKQWRRRINRAARAGHDLAPVAISLMLDAGDEDGARRVQLIADGLSAAERGRAITLPTPATAPVALLTHAQDVNLPPQPPTGPGTPSRRRKRRQRPLSASGGHALRLVSGDTRSVEDAARSAWRPGMTITQLQDAAGISRTAAAKYRRMLAAEAAGRIAR